MVEIDNKWRVEEFPFPLSPKTLPPSEGSWVKTWFGGYQIMDSFEKDVFQKADNRDVFSESPYSPTVLEANAMVAVLQKYSGDRINFIELGSGWGAWCLFVSVFCRGGMAEQHPSGCMCLALEAEPTHYQWTKKNLELSGVDHIALHGAIAAESGEVSFRTFRSESDTPGNWYGQSVHTKGDIKVPAYTLDEICNKFQLDNVACAHLDVQGAELAALQGAEKTLEKKVIDHFIIATHRYWEKNEIREDIEKRLSGILSLNYRLLCEVPRNSIAVISGLTNPVDATGLDGVQIWQRNDF